MLHNLLWLEATQLSRIIAFRNPQRSLRGPITLVIILRMQRTTALLTGCTILNRALFLFTFLSEGRGYPWAPDI